jgi:hypothetical protein
MENKVNDFFIKNVNYGHLIVFASIGFATCLYHSLKILSNLKVDDLFPRRNRFSELVETDTESENESEKELEEELELELEKELEDESESELESDSDYVQPKHYTVKLRKRKRN